MRLWQKMPIVVAVSAAVMTSVYGYLRSYADYYGPNRYEDALTMRR